MPTKDAVLPAALAATILWFRSFLIHRPMAAAALRPRRRLLWIRDGPNKVTICEAGIRRVPRLLSRMAWLIC